MSAPTMDRDALAALLAHCEVRAARTMEDRSAEWQRRAAALRAILDAPTPSAPTEPQAWREMAQECDEVGRALKAHHTGAAFTLFNASTALRAAAETVDALVRERDRYQAAYLSVAFDRAHDARVAAGERAVEAARAVSAITGEFPDEPHYWGETLHALDRALAALPPRAAPAAPVSVSGIVDTCPARSHAGPCVTPRLCAQKGACLASAPAAPTEDA